MSQSAALETKPAAVPARSFTPVVRPVIQRKCACGGTTGADGECENCKRNRQLLQRRAAESAAPAAAPESVHRTLSSPGRPLDAGTRNFMESRFGHDFSRVRVHTDSQAGESARAINAHAYTAGQSIAFAPGKYQPATPSGRHLLAHELAHTIQQSGLQRRANDLAVDTAPDSRLEHEAEHAAHSVMSGSGLPGIANRPATPLISRAVTTTSTGPTGTVKAKNATVPVTISPSSYANSLVYKVTPADGMASSLSGTEESFVVDKLYVPTSKGKSAEARFDNLARGRNLISVVDLNGNASTAQWQLRDSSSKLRKTWYLAHGFTSDNVAQAWADAGGAKFPNCPWSDCQIDHIVELQNAGANNAENLQPLEEALNGDAGGSLWTQISALARAIKAEKQLSSGSANQVQMIFKRAEMAVTKKGGSTPDPGTPFANPVTGANQVPWKGNTCISVGNAMILNPKPLPTKPSKTPSTPPVPTIQYQLTAKKEKTAKTAGSTTAITVPAAMPLVNDVELFGDKENKASSQLISGLLFDKLQKTAKLSGGVIEAKLDLRTSSKGDTRRPLSLDATAGIILLNVGPQQFGGRLSLPKPANADLKFTYPFLSPGGITEMDITDNDDIAWTGYIDPHVPFLGRLDVAYKDDSLTITKGLGLTELKPPLPNVRIVESSLGMQLLPEFRPSGKLGFEFGPKGHPTATAAFEATTDGKGFVATGKLKLNVPGLKKADADIIYRGGGEYGAGSWTGEFAIGMDDLHLPYVTSGSAVARLGGPKGMTLAGEFGLTLPGGSTASVQLGQENGTWIFAGSGTFKVPKIGDVEGAVSYDTSSKEITAKIGKVPFTLLGAHASIENLKGKFAPGHAPVFSGAGSLAINKGKLAGKVAIKLEQGKFSGSGKMSYPLAEGLTPEVTVIYKDDRLRVEAEITVAELKLAKGYERKEKLVDSQISIPIPGLSAGLAGVKAVIRFNLNAGFSFGGLAISPLTIAAGFNPLEHDPNAELAVTGKLASTSRIWVTAAVSGGVALELGASLIKAGAEVGLTLEGTAELVANLEAALDAKYKGHRLTANINATLGANLDVTARVIAYVLAYAKFLGMGTDTRYDIVLASKTFPTGAKFKLHAPFGYDSGADPKVTLPTPSQLVLEKPSFDPHALLDNIMSGASVKKTSGD